MKTIACYKVTPDNQDVKVEAGGSVSVDRAAMVLGEYDLVAIEEAARLAEATEGTCVLLSASDARLNDSKLTKAALSRGASELFCVIDDALASADAYQTASVLAGALRTMEFDVAVFGEGSADLYAQQVGPLVGALLGLPVVNAVGKVEPAGDTTLRVERVLEDEIEVAEVPLPAVLCVTTDINLPRIPQLKEILAAGKKPVTKWALADVGGMPEAKVETVSVLAPEDVARKNVVYEGCSAENIGALAADIRASL